MSSLPAILAASEPVGPSAPSQYMAKVTVQIAFNAGYLTPASLRTWTDVTDFVELGEGITITGGRGDERSTADANHLTLTFDNSDGRFTFGKTSGPYGSGVRLGRPIRVIADPVDGTEMCEFLGFIDELPTEWEGTDNYAKSTISATSRLARLGSTTKLKSVIQQAILPDSPAAYYTLGEPSGSTQANDSSGNSADPLVLAGAPALPVVFGSATGPGTDGLTAVQFQTGQFLATPEVFTPTTGFTLEAFVSAASPTSGIGLISYLPEIDFGLFVNAANKLGATVKTSGTTRTSLASSGDVADGATHHVAAKWDGTTLTLYLDGAVAGTSAVVSASLVASSMSVGGGSIDTTTPVVGDNPLDSPLTGVVAHAAVYTYLLSDTQVADHSSVGLTGYAGDTTSARLLRYAGYAGVESAAIVAETGQATVQHIDTTDKLAVELMRVMETTEGGVLYDERDGTTVFHNRAHRLTAASAFTLNMAEQEVESGYAPKADRSAVANDVTANDVSGRFTDYRFDDQSQSDNGVAAMSIETASEDPNEPLNQAGWALYKYKDIRERVPALTVNALAQVGKSPSCAQVMAATVGTKITVSNRPSQAQSSSVDYFIEGWTEVYGQESLFITWNLSPSSPEDLTLIVDDPVRGVVDTNVVAL